jgi:hypothetical protein
MAGGFVDKRRAEGRVLGEFECTGTHGGCGGTIDKDETIMILYE